MSNIGLMQSSNCSAKSLYSSCSHFLFVFSFFLELPIKRTAIEVFEQEINVILIVKNGID